MAYNQLFFQLDRLNSARVIEFQHPVTGAWADGAPASDNPNRFALTFFNIPAGEYRNLVGRLKGTTITAVYPGPVLVASGAATTTQLPAPTGLAATPTSSTTVGVSWNGVANATGYRLRVNGGTTYMPGLNTSYVVSGLAPSTAGSYEIQALYSGTGPYSSSDYSPAVQATTPAGSTPTPTGAANRAFLWGKYQSNFTSQASISGLPSGQFANELTAIQAQRSRVKVTGGGALAPLQYKVNDRQASDTSSSDWLGGYTMPGYFFEQYSSGQMRIGGYGKGGTPASEFLPASNPANTSGNSGFLFQQTTAAGSIIKQDWASLGFAWDSTNVVLLDGQQENGGDQDSWVANTMTFWDNYSDTVGVPNGCLLLVWMPNTQTNSGNVAQARVNVLKFRDQYTRHRVVPIDGAGYHLDNTVYHLDYVSQYAMWQEVMRVVVGTATTVRTVYTSEARTASCGAGFTGSNVTRQGISTANLARAQTDGDTRANAALVCTPSGGAGGTTYSYTTTAQDYQAKCGNAPAMPYTGVVRTSNVSPADAKQQAIAAITCVVVVNDKGNAVWSNYSTFLVADGGTLSDNGTGGEPVGRVQFGGGLGGSDPVKFKAEFYVSRQLAANGSPINNQFGIALSYNPGGSRSEADIIGGWFCKFDGPNDGFSSGVAPRAPGISGGPYFKACGQNSKIGIQAEVDGPDGTGIRFLIDDVALPLYATPITAPVFLDISTGFWDPYAQIKKLSIYAPDPVPTA